MGRFWVFSDAGEVLGVAWSRGSCFLSLECSKVSVKSLWHLRYVTSWRGYLFMRQICSDKPTQPVTFKAFRVTLGVTNSLVLNGFCLSWGTAPSSGHFNSSAMSLGFTFLFSYVRWGKVLSSSRGGAQDRTTIPAETLTSVNRSLTKAVYTTRLYERVFPQVVKKYFFHSLDLVATKLISYSCVFWCWEVRFMLKSWILWHLKCLFSTDNTTCHFSLIITAIWEHLQLCMKGLLDRFVQR